jgi:hypothetical protein
MLTALRGTDGRRLAAALACLMLVVALLGGFHTGMALAADGNAAFCGHAASGPGGGLPADRAADPCCAAGYLSYVPALDTPPPGLAGPRLAGGVPIAPARARSRVRDSVFSNYRPRGPPSFA